MYDSRREADTKTTNDLPTGESVVAVSHVPLSLFLARDGDERENMASNFSCPSSEAGIDGLRAKNELGQAENARESFLRSPNEPNN
jgi:hypothetical protein